jgi:hypothetical protein
MPRLNALLHRLVKLRDLHLEVGHARCITWAKAQQLFLELQSLEISGCGTTVTLVLNWSTHSLMPKLSTLRLKVVDDGHGVSLITASSFLKRNGANLTTFGYAAPSQNPAEDVFPHTPRLEYVELGSLFQKKDILQYLPTSVVDVTFSMLEQNINHVLNITMGMMASVEDLPIGSKLSTFTAVIDRASLDNVSFSQASAGKKPNDKRVEVLDRWVKHLSAGRIRVLDEEGTDLKNVIAAMSSAK